MWFEIAALILSFVLTVVLGKILLPILRKLKMGQMIREDGPTWHNTKQGTPMMGGLMFIGAITVTVIALGFPGMLRGEIRHLLVLGIALLNGAIGFIDDYAKMKKKQNMGLSAGKKFAIQLVAAAAVILLMGAKGYLTNEMYLPFFNGSLHIWKPAYYLLIAFILVGCVNAVNLTDGVDGLLSGVTIPVAVFFAAACFCLAYRELGVFAAALLGGLGGFLVYNFHPAKVFMGDTGSLFIGGAVCGMALAADIPLVLIPVGIVYILETLSDILQVGYFKLTHGKRIFKMAPIHHHFELCGWSEVKIFWIFSAVSALGALLGFLGIRGLM